MNQAFVRHIVGEQMSFACVVPTVNHGGGVMMWGGCAGDTVSDLFRIQKAHLTSRATTAFCSDPIWFALSRTIIILFN